jgi:hypothetical protein
VVLFVFRYKGNKYQFHVPRYVKCKTVWLNYLWTYVTFMSQESVFSVVTRLHDGWFGGLIPGGGKIFFPCVEHVGWLWGPLSLVFHGYWGLLSLGGRAARGMRLNHWPLYNAKIKTEWSYTPAPQYMLSQYVWRTLTLFLTFLLLCLFL